ncbi:MAG: hypothetical protein KAS73_03330 [Candidatus Sabulitectum sp.]|nr:hypothetical protein [Candidatus Sabulitectum sp.]
MFIFNYSIFATGTIATPNFTALSPALGTICFHSSSIEGSASMSFFSIDERLTPLKYKTAMEYSPLKMRDLYPQT